MEDIFRTFLPSFVWLVLLTGNTEGLVPDVDEGPLHNGQHLEVGWDHYTRWLDPGYI